MSHEAVERVRAYLRTHAPELEVVEFDQSTATAPLAAAAIGCDVGAIVKSLCFLVDGQPVIALVAGDMKADDKKLARLFGVSNKRVKIADPDTVERVTGFSVGGVSPVAYADHIPILIDRSLERYTMVYAAAGAAHAIFGVPLSQLIELSGGRIEDIVKTSIS
jgi:Cys-tRNA(Pro) deacylase